MGRYERLRRWLWYRQVKKAYYWKIESREGYKSARKCMDLLLKFGEEQGWRVD